MDILAGLVLLVFWLLGGAAMFDSNQTKFWEVFIGWSALNAFLAAAVAIMLAGLWAINRLFA